MDTADSQTTGCWRASVSLWCSASRRQPPAIHQCKRRWRERRCIHGARSTAVSQHDFSQRRGQSWHSHGSNEWSDRRLKRWTKNRGANALRRRQAYQGNRQATGKNGRRRSCKVLDVDAEVDGLDADDEGLEEDAKVLDVDDELDGLDADAEEEGVDDDAELDGLDFEGGADLKGAIEVEALLGASKVECVKVAAEVDDLDEERSEPESDYKEERFFC